MTESALANCQKCQGVMANSADRCPYCGHKSTSKLLKTLILTAVFAVLVVIFVIPNGGNTDNDSPFKSGGYFKDSSKNRIFTVQMDIGTTQSSALSYARSQPYTAEQMTAVYFYPTGSTMPNDGITLANSTYQANHVLYDMQGSSKWRYAYMRHIKGNEIIVDCVETPKNDLCKQ